MNKRRNVRQKKKFAILFTIVGERGEEVENWKITTMEMRERATNDHG
jgi:hypothetical protein